MPRSKCDHVAMGLRARDHVHEVRMRDTKHFLRILKMPPHVEAFGNGVCLVGLYVANSHAFKIRQFQPGRNLKLAPETGAYHSYS